jgi:hypothetical protein
VWEGGVEVEVEVEVEGVEVEAGEEFRVEAGAVEAGRWAGTGETQEGGEAEVEACTWVEGAVGEVEAEDRLVAR